MSDPVVPERFPPLEARLCAALCESLAASFTEKGGLPTDREMAQMAEFAVLDVLRAAGLWRPELEQLSLEKLSRLTRPGVLPAVPHLWACAEGIASWARQHAPETPSSDV